MFQNGDFVWFSIQVLKNKKLNFSPAILKLEFLLYHNIYILFHLILYSQSDFDSKKKSGLIEKKNMPFNILLKSTLNIAKKNLKKNTT